MKKGEVTSQIFLYVMVVVVMGLSLLLGYKYISQFSNQASVMSLDIFKKDLTTSINTVSTNFGEVDVVDLKLPTKYSKVCFINNGANPELDKYPLIQSSVDSGAVDNVFVMSKKIELSFKTANIIVEQGPLCIDNNAGVVKIKIESLGNSVKLSQAK